MGYGFSVYFGLDNTKEENIRLLEFASKQGYTRIFTSFHIPEADYTNFKAEVLEFFSIAKNYGMDIISDISPNTFKLLGIDGMNLSALKELGVQTVRIDFGYSTEEIAQMSKNECGVKIQLNASTITKEFFCELDNLNASYKNIDALHNFYPRVGTGISKECLIEKNAILRKRGIKIAAFVMSNSRKRGPLYDGLPTLEDHRNMKVKDAANHLFALGNDYVFIGDSLPSDRELLELASLEPDVIDLDIEIKTKNQFVRELLENTFSARVDEARDAVRAAETRLLLDGNVIKNENSVDIKVGDITIDNKWYGRYMGELQISKVNKGADKRTNVIGRVKEKDMYLIKYIKGGRKFRLRFKEYILKIN